MTKSAVESFFKRNIIPPKGYIYCDIKREIDLARSGKSGGELLAALGLLSYTEFMGKLLLKNDGSYTKQFRSFFRSMGDEYERLIDSREVDVYQVFRSGLVQSYFIKNCEIKMIDDNYSCGIIINPDGKFLFVIEKYFADFISACQKLYTDMLSDPDVYLPSA
jgi:hypothetical protein